VCRFVSQNKTFYMDKTLLKKVKDKRGRRNILTETDFQLNINDFVMKIYDVCTPNKYGEAFPNKIYEDIGPFIGKMNRDFDRGDLHINYSQFYEAKISFLDIKDSYSITNIRDWQDLDYFILCFVDGNFKPKVYCVPKGVVTNNPKLKLTGMNNSKLINSYNTYVGKRVTFSSTEVDYLFKNSNVLSGTTYKHLLSFLKQQIKKYRK